jgi:hypothetical protein
MVYSIANPATLSHIENFLKSKTIDKTKFKFVLIGYLYKEGERKIFTKEGENYSNSHQFEFFFELIESTDINQHLKNVLPFFYPEKIRKKSKNYILSLFESIPHHDSEDEVKFNPVQESDEEEEIKVSETKSEPLVENKEDIQVKALKLKILQLENQLKEQNEFIQSLKKTNETFSLECEKFLTKQIKKKVEEEFMEELKRRDEELEIFKEEQKKFQLTIKIMEPHYWKPNQSKIMIKLDENSDEYRIMNHMMNSNFGEHGDKYGVTILEKKDPKSFHICSIYRNQNLDLWTRYQLKKKLMVHKYHDYLPEFEESKYLQQHKALVPCLDSTANEYWTFHGTSKEYLNVLLNDGYDPRVSSLIGMFGAGFYLSENSSKSNQYIPCSGCGKNVIFKKSPCKCTEEPTLWMIIYRVTLGHPHIALEYSKEKYRGFGDGTKIEGTGTMYSKSEFGNAVRRPPNKPGSLTPYDSIVGEKMEFGANRLKFREYVLFEKDQAYPEYVVEYKRSGENHKSDVENFNEMVKKFLTEVEK